ncbi:MAG: MgtC/SapB family protein [Planctomycetes bacterium]|nr:MgtC/SapB family protein [Planctomycetota bacterium]
MDTFSVEWSWPESAHVVRVIVAVILGGLIGLERELRDKPAGFRTIILICLGACVLTILSQVMGSPDGESTRIAAQIVTGIGFIGAGAILRDRQSVYGLTTAATIWAVAAIGMAVGFGELGLAVLGTLAILVALFVFDAVEHWIGDRRDIQEYHILTANRDGALDRVRWLFDNAQLHIRKWTCYEDGPSLVIHMVVMGGKTRHERLRVMLTRSEQYTLIKG